ncbi:hypothetical protein G6L29_30030 [Agrobacterium rhizogenes]|uniref:hypothetical protein n=1 Tax=Rhizobium rhizogenes TaxID=359 RepID=UPI000645625C|nr:hypothetical protein [Rhizobium rhizogenes]NTG91104.1 hypothetical protein [Rhizobium rhizogenes]NTI19906.1 hypothetical protein [Rhizobium rhizogenes]QRM40603.1 hypothetical protein F3X89_22620 [Rhizobium rhizogenes]
MPNEQHLKSVFSECLVDTKRTPKYALASWLDMLIGMAHGSGSDQDYDLVISGIKNNLALILFYCEDARAAKNCCIDQVYWAFEIGRADLMVQPIVNLIRLNRLVGDVAAASLLLADIERSFLGGHICFEDLRKPMTDVRIRKFLSVAYTTERFKLVLPEGEANCRELLSDTQYAYIAGLNPLFLAEQNIRAGLIYECADLYQSGLNVMKTYDNPYVRILAHYYGACWDACYCTEIRKLENVSASTLALSRAIIDSHPAIDHRFGRYLYSLAAVSAHVSSRYTSDLYAELETIAGALNDVHLGLLADAGLGSSQEVVTGKILETGYRNLPHFRAPTVSPVTQEILRAKLGILMEMIGGNGSAVPGSRTLKVV